MSPTEIRQEVKRRAVHLHTTEQRVLTLGDMLNIVEAVVTEWLVKS